MYQTNKRKCRKYFSQNNLHLKLQIMNYRVKCQTFFVILSHLENSSQFCQYRRFLWGQLYDHVIHVIIIWLDYCCRSCLNLWWFAQSEIVELFGMIQSHSFPQRNFIEKNGIKINFLRNLIPAFCMWPQTLWSNN